MSQHKLRAAVIGCGAISDIYLTNLRSLFTTVDVVCCCAQHLEHAKIKAKQYGIESRTYSQILADASIQLVILLTPASTHATLIQQALLAGKHVYTEKTMATSLEDAEALLRLAQQRGLYLGSAPDTFLGASLQQSRRIIDSGVLGRITGFSICANRCLDMLASKFMFLRLPGGGLCFDYGVYYLTALVSLLGPVAQVAAMVGNRAQLRRNCIPSSPDFGQPYSYPNESYVSATLQLRSGICGTFALNGDSIGPDQAIFTIHGTNGILELGCPDHFGDPLSIIQTDADAPNISKRIPIQLQLPFSANSRGLGAAEMAHAISQGVPCRCDASFAFHVLEVIVQIMQSGDAQAFRSVVSSCSRPEPLDATQATSFAEQS